MRDSVFIRLLTGGDIVIDGALEVQWTSRTGKAILALVCLNPTLAENRERLTALLWPNSDARSASNNLRSALATLRRNLRDARADVIDANRDSIALVIDTDQVDIWRFQSLTKSSDLAGRREGLELYQGDLLSGIGLMSDEFDDIIRAQRELYRDHATAAAAELLESLHLEGTDNEFAVVLHRLLEIDPANEHGYQLAIQRAGDVGNRAEALRLFNSYETGVRRIYGVGPSDPILRLRDGIIANGRDVRPVKPRASSEPKYGNWINNETDEPDQPTRRNYPLLAAAFLGVAGIALVTFQFPTDPRQSVQSIVSIVDVRINTDRCSLAITQEDVRQHLISGLAQIPDIAVVLVREAGAFHDATYSLTLTVTCVGPDLRLDATLTDDSDGTQLWVGSYNGSAEGMRSLLSLLGDDLQIVL